MSLFLFRYATLWLALGFAALTPYWALQPDASVLWWLVALVAWALSALGIHDALQAHHAILRPSIQHNLPHHLATDFPMFVG